MCLLTRQWYRRLWQVDMDRGELRNALSLLGISRDGPTGDAAMAARG